MKAKKENFSEWYTEVLQESGLSDYTKVSGCIVFRPYSFAIWEKLVAEVDKRFKKIGIKNCYFPLLIPKNLLEKEVEHFKGFAPEVAWVTKTGGSDLDEHLAIRPTSEVIMYDSYAKWIRSHRDLPLRLNQWVNVVRWEFKHPTPFLRTREFLFNEGHTVFATKKEAEAESKQILDIYQDVQENYLALPGIRGKKSDKEKFAGAEYSLTFEHILPDKKAIQGPDFHHDGQNFSKMFKIQFLDQNEKMQFAYQNTFAITTRQIGIMVATHGDDKGLVLPPKIAPTQVIIIPIYDNKSKKQVLAKAKEMQEFLSDFRVEIDNREGYTPGWKFHDAELKGIPLRVEIGPRDLANKTVVLARRDTGEKKEIKLNKLGKEVPAKLDAIQKNLFDKAKKFLDESIHEANNMDALKIILNTEKGFVRAGWCGSRACEDDVKDKTGAKITNMPFGLKAKGKCVDCGKPAKFVAHFAKSY
ncbi:proline--tRNA ligase [Candidatus Woesearchaeota archaeon]|jgi:prolyl-tRNA synthetase|nr:proline--tRNA ligase [Candidatus Woesearchaeota archaeon]MBT7062863.1 proline--tRNA ligase [Candidatus Woesearchaeota archaeon]MBT7402991.1 proline--tRNA ligase [Candidatus Woesearchaeota archaeon]